MNKSACLASSSPHQEGEDEDNNHGDLSSVWTNDNDTSRSSAAYVNSSYYTDYDESSFSIPDVSSVCDDSEAFALALAHHNRTTNSNSNSNSNSAVGSTGMTFQDFLLCFDKRIQSSASARGNDGDNQKAQALTKGISTVSSASSSNNNKYQQFRQILSQHSNSQLSSAQQHRLLRVRSADSSSYYNSNSNKLVSLPRFLWQPDDGLCCQAESVHHMMQNEQNELNQRNTKVAMEGLVLFEEPAYGDDHEIEDDQDNSNEQQEGKRGIAKDAVVGVGVVDEEVGLGDSHIEFVDRIIRLLARR